MSLGRIRADNNLADQQTARLEKIKAAERAAKARGARLDGRRAWRCQGLDAGGETAKNGPRGWA